MKRVSTVVASGELEALGDYVDDRYAASGNSEYRGYRVELQRAAVTKWREWDRRSDSLARGRRWRVVVTLAHGRRQHEVKLRAFAS